MTSTRIEPVQDKAEERQLAGELERYQEAWTFLSERRARLTRQYPNQWVAIHRRKLVAHSRRLSEIERELRRLGLHRSHVLLEFLTEKRQTLIL